MVSLSEEMKKRLEVLMSEQDKQRSRPCSSPCPKVGRYELYLVLGI